MRRELKSVVLAVLIVVTALAIIYVRHEGRRGFAELQQLEAQRDELVTDWGRLQLEYATWAAGNRVESLARTELGLREVQPKQIVVIVE